MKHVSTSALIVSTFVLGWVPAMAKFVLLCPTCPYVPLEHVSRRTEIVLGVLCNGLYTLKVTRVW